MTRLDHLKAAMRRQPVQAVGFATAARSEQVIRAERAEPDRVVAPQTADEGARKARGPAGHGGRVWPSLAIFVVTFIVATAAFGGLSVLLDGKGLDVVDLLTVAAAIAAATTSERVSGWLSSRTRHHDNGSAGGPDSNDRN